MVDRFLAVVRHQVLLADIGDVAALRFGEQVVEGLVLRRAKRLGNGFVPFLAVGEVGSTSKITPRKSRDLVAHDLADPEARKGHVDRLRHAEREQLRKVQKGSWLTI